MIEVTLSDGTSIPALGFGTYRCTGGEGTRAVEHALKVGYRHLDMAQAYDNQREIAPVIAHYPREELYLTSKLWIGDHTKKRVPKACDKILKELGVEYLNLLLIHWPDRTVPIEETLEAMAKLQEEGKVRSLGVSNFTKRHLTDALATGIPIVMNQIECHPYFYQTELVTFCQEQGIAITAYAPLHKGKVAQEPILNKIGAKHGKTASQVTLRWLLQKGIIAIPKSAHKGRIEENFAIFDFELSEAEKGEIDQLNTEQRTISPTFADFSYD